MKWQLLRCVTPLTTECGQAAVSAPVVCNYKRSWFPRAALETILHYLACCRAAHFLLYYPHTGCLPEFAWAHLVHVMDRARKYRCTYGVHLGRYRFESHYLRHMKLFAFTYLTEEKGSGGLTEGTSTAMLRTCYFIALSITCRR